MKISTKLGTTTAILLSLWVNPEVQSQNIAKALEVGKSELTTAQNELATVRKTIAEEKIPLASSLRELETTALEKRRESDRLQRMSDTRGLDVKQLEDELKLRNDDVSYISNLLVDYANRLNASIDPTEVGLYTDSLLEIVNMSDQQEVPKQEVYTKRLSAIETGLARLDSIIGGVTFSGKAVLPSGKFTEGKFALMGPVAYFASSDGSIAGLCERSSSMEPRVVVFNEKAQPAIKSFIDSGEGEILMDVTLGKAKAIATTKDSVATHIAKGGVWMGPILFFALLSVALGIYKAIELLTIKKLNPGSLAEVLKSVRSGDTAEAEAYLKKQPGPSSEMLQGAVKNLSLPKELLEEFMFETMLATQPKVERGLSILAITAAIAPLLGLLGTVTGMINTFKLITLFGTGDAKSLSGGISEALITTEFGLIVAIPALLMSAFLSRKANSILADMEKLSIGFMNGISSMQASGGMSTKPDKTPSKGANNGTTSGTAEGAEPAMA